MKTAQLDRFKYRCIGCGFNDSFNARQGIHSAGQAAHASGWRFQFAAAFGVGVRAHCPACAKSRAVR